MNTPSNPFGTGVLNGAGVPGGLPDVAELTRLANEFYSTPPGYSTRCGVTRCRETSRRPQHRAVRRSEAALSSSPASGKAYNVPHSAAGANVAPSFLDNRPAGIPSEVPGPDAVASYPGATTVQSVAPEVPYTCPLPHPPPITRARPARPRPEGPYGFPHRPRPVPRTFLVRAAPKARTTCYFPHARHSRARPHPPRSLPGPHCVRHRLPPARARFRAIHWCSCHSPRSASHRSISLTGKSLLAAGHGLRDGRNARAGCASRIRCPCRAARLPDPAASASTAGR